MDSLPLPPPSPGCIPPAVPLGIGGPAPNPSLGLPGRAASQAGRLTRAQLGEDTDVGPCTLPPEIWVGMGPSFCLEEAIGLGPVLHSAR